MGLSQINAMKEYAKQVATKALKDAAENAQVHCDGWDSHGVDTQTILETEIKLP